MNVKGTDADRAGPGQPARSRQAVVFVPGIDHYATTRDVAVRMAAALDVQARTGTAVFPLGPTDTLKYADVDSRYGDIDPSEQYSSPRYTIARAEEPGSAAEAVPIVDVFRLDYQDNLTGAWRRRNIFVQAALLAVTIVLFVFALIPVIVRKLKFFEWTRKERPEPTRDEDERARGRGRRRVLEWRRPKRILQWRDLLQLLLVSLLLSVFVAYLAVLVVALVDTIRAVGSDDPELTSFQSFAVVATVIGFASPRTLKERFVESAVNYLTMTQYIVMGARRRAVTGQFTAMIEQLHESGEYESIHVVAYSFGSIVALDALFPPDQSPPPRFDQIDGVVTIGAPVDLVREFRPKYYQRRRDQGNGVAYRWHNIFIPADVLASNLRDDPECFIPPEKVEVAPPEFEIGGNIAHNHVYPLEPGGSATGLGGIVGAFVLAGLNAHQNYWGRRPSDQDAFWVVVPALFADQPDGPLS